MSFKPRPPGKCLHCGEFLEGGTMVVRYEDNTIAGYICGFHTLHEIVFSPKGFTVSLERYDD